MTTAAHAEPPSQPWATHRTHAARGAVTSRTATDPTGQASPHEPHEYPHRMLHAAIPHAPHEEQASIQPGAESSRPRTACRGSTTAWRDKVGKIPHAAGPRLEAETGPQARGPW